METLLKAFGFIIILLLPIVIAIVRQVWDYLCSPAPPIKIPAVTSYNQFKLKENPVEKNKWDRYINKDPIVVKSPPTASFFGRVGGDHIESCGKEEVQYLSYIDQRTYYELKGMNWKEIPDLIGKNMKDRETRERFTAKE
jgi:hypothetical protein